VCKYYSIKLTNLRHSRLLEVKCRKLNGHYVVKYEDVVEEQ